MSVAYNPEEARVPPVLPPPPLPVSKFKVALCQLSVTADKKRNIVHAKKAIEEVAGKGAELVILPVGAHLICYPSAFEMTTGPLVWELLQRARAADNQLFVATCSPARDSGAGYIAWGHSMLVGPIKSPPGEAKARRSVPVSRRTEDELALNVAETYPNRGNVGTL